jgi:hypothetical protein
MIFYDDLMHLAFIIIIKDSLIGQYYHEILEIELINLQIND